MKDRKELVGVHMGREDHHRDAALDRRTFLRAGLGVAGLAMAGAGCGGSSTANSTRACSITQRCARPTIRAGGAMGGSFPSPFTSQLLPAYANMILLYDTLLWNDSTGGFVGWLASSFSRSPDGLVYTYQLRDNVRWHDGIAFTADDVVFTFGYMTAFKGPQPLGLPSVPVRATATGPLTVEIRLPEPDTTFQTFTAATLPIIPRHIWSSITDPAKAQDVAVLVGTGPYQLTSFSKAEGTLEFEARDDYFLAKPFAKTIQYHNVGNGDQLTGLLASDIDVGTSPPAGVVPDALTPFRTDHTFGILPTSDGFAVTLRWNLARGGPLADARFRRACAMAINRNDMVTRLLGGDGSPGNPGYLAPSNPSYGPSVEQYRFDPAGAGRLLDQAGYKMGPSGTRLGLDGKPLQIALLVVNTAPAAGQLVVSYLSAIGVKLTAQSRDVPTLFGQLTSGNYDMAIAFNGGAKRDPDIIRQNFCNPGFADFRHTQGYDNAQLDDLGARQLAALDPATRKMLISQMQHIVATDIPILTLYYATSYLVFRKAVFGQWASLPATVDGGPFYNPNKHNFVFGEPAGMKPRPEGP